MVDIKINTEQEYNKYSNFIVENLHKVTSGLKVVLPQPFGLMTFDEIVNADVPTAKLVVWTMLKQENLSLYIFKINHELVSFAVMELK